MLNKGLAPSHSSPRAEEMLDSSARDVILALATVAEYGPEEVICEEGEPGDWMFVVSSGEVDVIKHTEDGAPVRVSTLGPGDFGGVLSVFGGEPRSATLRARGRAQLCLLDNATFGRLIAQHPPIAMAMLDFMARRMRRDSSSLASTLQYVTSSGYEHIYRECSPKERLILDNINLHVAAASSLEAVMQFLFDSLSKLGGCDRVSLALVDDGGGRVTTLWVGANYEPILLKTGYSQDLHGSSLERVIQEGAPRVINDLESYLADHPDSGSTQLIVNEGIRSSMTCPLSVDGRHVGLLFRSSTQKHVYTEHQVRMHLAIAERLGQAVEKAYRIRQLEAAQRSYFEMLGFVSHELKSPVASMVGDAEIMLAGYLGDLQPGQRDKLSRMTAKGRYLLGLVRDYLDLARLEGTELQASVALVDDVVAQIIEPAIEVIRPEIEQAGLTLECVYPDSSVDAKCDQGLLKIVMVNLLGNAAKYADAGGRVKVNLTGDQDRLAISVWNTGPGFPEAQKPQLFRKFSRLDTPELKKRRGTGVGLYTCWRIVQLHGGSISASSQEGQWAEFRLAVPRFGAVQEDAEKRGDKPA